MSDPKIQRWECETNEFGDSDMQKNIIGNYVRYEDYARLKAEVERLTKAGDAMQDDLLFVVWPWNQKRFPSINAWNAAKEGKQS